MTRRGVRLCTRLRRPFTRALVILLVGAQPCLGVPLAAAQGRPGRTAAGRPPSPTVTVNRTLPRVAPPATRLTFSEAPTAQEITRARVFAEALVPVGTTSATENRALASAIASYHHDGDKGVAGLESFLATHPESAWRPALLVNLGRLARERGEFSGALARWEEAWRFTKADASVAGTAVANDAMGELLRFASDWGHVPLLQQYLTEAGTRSFTGPAVERVGVARGTLRSLELHGDQVLSCGRHALGLLWPLLDQRPVPEALRRPGREDVTLGEVRALAGRLGLPLAAVMRPAGAELSLPAVVHFRIGHYALLVRTDGQRYLLRDPAVGGELWITRAALDQELSGYMLVPAQARPAGWRDVTDDEAATVVGRSLCEPGAPDSNQPPCDGPNSPTCCLPPRAGASGGSSNCSGPCGGMPVYRIEEFSARLLLTDTPIGYAPARGPAVWFTLRYHSGQYLHPQIPVYGWLGPSWTHDWLAYAEEAPAYCGTGGDNSCYPAAVLVYLRGGGREWYHTPNADGVYPPDWRTQAQLVRVSIDPIRYERRLPSGDVEVFSLPDTAPAGQRRVFLTEVRDAQGQAVTLTYDAQYRVVALTDALGQVTTLAYEDAADSFHLTRITDPFGRTATLGYDGAGQLARLTDTLGLTSSVTYGVDNLIVSLTTPYGTTTFRHGTDYYNPTLEVTDAEGGTERVEYRWETTAWPASDPTGEVPAEFAAANTRLNTYTTVHWTPQAWAAGPGNVANATLTRWLLWAWTPYATVRAVGVPHSIKRPLERRVWYAYPNQTNSEWIGTGAQPAVVARVLDDGTVQRTQATYNVQGQVTSRTDPVGRQTTYGYATNGLDLLEVRQITPGGSDLLSQYANYTPGHQPQTVTDAAGQTTTLTYNAAGQVLTRTNAKQETTTYAYDADGRLQSVTGPVTGATTTYTYDGYGLVRTVTGPDGYTVTTDYDVFDRPTRVTYPDGTYDETTYDRLDVASRRDRLGRVTRYFYDAFRRLRATRDPAGRTIQQQWGASGLAKLIDAKGQTTSWERDVQGRVTRELRADGVTATVYAYQAASGRLATVTDPKAQVTTYAYADDDSVTGMTYANATIATPSVTYTYDPVYSRVSTMVDGTGTTTYTYHPAGTLGAGQVAIIDGPLPNDTIAYAYDELGRVVSRAINGTANTTTQVYDALGRVTSETNVLGTFTYAYVGATGRLQLVTYPNGQTSSYAYYDNLGDQRLQTIHHRRPDSSTLSRFDYTYDIAGNILTWQQQADSDAPTVWNYDYDRADQLTSAVHQTIGAPASIIKRYAYTYDSAGNRTSEQIDDAVTVATHDSLNRLLTHQPGGPLVIKGTLNEPGSVKINGLPGTVDAANQFQTTAPVTTGTNTVTINAVDASGNATEAVYEVDQAGIGKTFTYDGNGNMTSDGTRTFEWDARNQLVAVNVGTHRSEFYYDGMQRRVREVESADGLVQAEIDVLWCGRAACEERTPLGGINRRLLALGEQALGEGRYFASDHLGTPRDITDAAGALVARYDFDPWGRRSIINGNDLWRIDFTGHRRHASAQLTLTLHRAYDAALSRWLSEDPIGLQGGINLYSYAGQRPVSVVDPFGLLISCLSTVSSRMVGTTVCGADHWGCTDPGRLDKPEQIAITQCKEHCGKWHFDAIVTLPLTVEYSRDPDKTVLSSVGMTIRRHEEEHVQDYQDWCHGLNRRFGSEGFSSRSQCQQALDNFLRGYVETWNRVHARSNEVRDQPR